MHKKIKFKNLHKRFYDRETIFAVNYITKQMFHTPLSFSATKIITPFLIQGSQPIMIT